MVRIIGSISAPTLVSSIGVISSIAYIWEIDGGYADSIYLTSQLINGGSAESTYSSSIYGGRA